MDIRLATLDDAKIFADILSQYVETPFYLDFQQPTEEFMKEKINSVTKKYPWVVCLKAGVVTGFAYAESFRDYQTYQWDVRTTVYVDKNFQGRKSGSCLYNALIDILKLQNAANIFTYVTRPNLMGESLHRSRGFKPLCVLPKAAYKNGQWHDITLYHKVLSNLQVPKDFVPFPKLNPAEVFEICDKNAKK